MIVPFALSVSVMALLIAFGSAVFAWRAIDQAEDAKEIALAGRGDEPQLERRAPTNPTDLTESTDSSAGNLGGPTASGQPPRLDERTVYNIKYEDQTLTLKATETESMELDLDEPRANVRDEADIRLEVEYGTAQRYLELVEDVQGSEGAGPGSTPYDCAEKIRTAPLGSSRVPVKQGVVICVMTSFSAAQKRGDPQRMVRLEVTGVGADQAVTVKVSAWDIPR
ncbi:hypothetical protein O7627_13550 [Solwaraspora sp. WMMD1047]|uniref:hypothetical protein n=1 Tax=Solwaraspora sp. WMMD1047 TaxID=3016102 RepID=UPI0024170A6E|nr:hypothetical protein [Solwaraspora sp. WMMD1047]MDG4830324.1 hypothetical protein [Solwaraspora sp. WMMD1047]